MDELQTIVGDHPAFLEQVLKEIEEAGFALTDFSQMDHMCYRVPSLERYKLKKSDLAKVGKCSAKLKSTVDR